MNLTVDGDSNYTTTGNPDTYTAVSDGSGGTEAVSEQINGVCQAVVELQALLGDATELKGSVADLVTRLARNLDTNGTLPKGNAFPTLPAPVEGQMFYRQDLDSLYIFNGVSWLTVTQGTAQGTIDHGSLGGLLDDGHPQYLRTDGSRVETGDHEIKKNTPRLRLKGTEASAQEYALTESGGDLRLERNDGSESVPSWTLLSSLLNAFFPVPTNTGAGSTLAFGGDFTSSGDANLSGVNFYNTFHLQAGHTYTVPTGKKCVVIVAKTSITIDGTITSVGAGGAGGTGITSGATQGEDGTDQPAGGGGHGDAGSDGANGGRVLLHGCVLQAGGAGGATGSAPTQISGADVTRLWQTLSAAMGGAGGGSGGNDSGPNAGAAGGNGGGTIVLIAPVITLANTAVLNSSGQNGTDSVNVGAGGGGSAGNIWLIYRQLTDAGATYTMTKGTKGVASGAGGSGGDGVDGVKQLLVLQ